MRLFKAALFFGMTMLLLVGGLFPFASQQNNAYAQSASTPQATPAQTSTPPTGHRTTKIKVAFTSYRWWLIRYSNNNIACSFTVDHEGTPVAGDVEALCDTKTYNEWKTTPPCDHLKVGGQLSNCPGFYLQPVSSAPAEKELTIELPLPSVWISVTNCNSPKQNDMECTRLPNLKFTGEEPLPNETMINIQGTIGGETFNCMGNICEIPIKPTGMDGEVVEFWGNSSFGDSTEHYTARVRLIPWGDFMNPEAASNDPSKWYVDILSDQWRGGKLATCSDTWQVFPDIGGPPEWLSTTAKSEDLGSDTSYYYLAGSLITYGEVDASGCLDGGLQAPNIASPCGVEAARPKLMEWQNRFDDEIIQVSGFTGVPARLLKNVFARESQIWPGIYTTYKEAGLGQLTSNGADTVLLWNPDFFSQFCPLVLNKKFCELGFGNLGDAEQNMLRGALVRKVNASCPNCPAGIDLTQANYSVRVFAEGMLANCEQVGRVVTNITGLLPGQTSSYEDLWRFTLVNYNAGAGCLSGAVSDAWNANQRIDWASVSSQLDPVCQGAIGYVEDISRMLKVNPTPTVWVPGGGNEPTPAMPRVIVTSTPTLPPFLRTPSPTPTVTGTIFATPGTITPTGTLATPVQTATPTPLTATPGTVTPTEEATGYPY